MSRDARQVIDEIFDPSPEILSLSHWEEKPPEEKAVRQHMLYDHFRNNQGWKRARILNAFSEIQATI